MCLHVVVRVVRAGFAGAAEVEVPHLGPEQDLQVSDDEGEALHDEEESGHGGELVRGGGLGGANVVPGNLRTWISYVRLACAGDVAVRLCGYRG